ncbi:MAG: tryptophan synthase subunit beta [Patescibacteria group bacterium]|nr:tryptophan synthase subunit beta [Patescibacteria group bacterium]
MTIQSLKSMPDTKGFFGKYGGQYVPPELIEVLREVDVEYHKARGDSNFQEVLAFLLRDYVGRPSPLYFAEKLTAHCGGAKIYLKREDLNHTGAHKINHCLGEALLAQRMGKKKLLAETGAGQHGVAVATAAALVGLEAEIHMGTIDIAKQHPNVVRMSLLGAKIVPVSSGGKSLKDAVDSAFQQFVRDHEHTFFAIGSVVGPHPYPMMIRDFQSIVGREAKRQILEHEGRLPDCLIACVGGGSNAIGLFHEFLDDHVSMVGVEPSGKSAKLGEHAATLTFGKPGMIHGMFTYLLQDDHGEPAPVYSIASGLDYPGVGPAHAHLKDAGRIEYVTASDQESINAFQLLCKIEGIIPALESSHALAETIKRAARMPKDAIIIMNLSGRGDKDVDFVAKYHGFSC